MHRTQSVNMKEPVGSASTTRFTGIGYHFPKGVPTLPGNSAHAIIPFAQAKYKLPEATPYEPQRGVDLELSTYLPSLYLKKCRKVESLDRVRSQFPSVENVETKANKPIAFSPSLWDNVITEMKHEVFVRKELKKHEIALKAFLAKKCQMKFKKRQLKREELTCFHRVLCSHLAEGVMNKFAETRAHQEEPQAAVQPAPVMNIQGGNSLSIDNDVFIEGEDNKNFNDGGNNMFDDILLGSQPAPVREEEVVKAANTDNFIIRMIENAGRQENPMRVDRRALLRKIKENLKKRQKYKERSNPNAPKTGAAEIILATLINNEPEEEISKEPVGIARNVSTSSINQEVQKKRRRKDDGFVLNWQESDYQDAPLAKKFMEGRNLKFDNINELLSLFVLKDSKNEHFAKSFEKTIESDKEFPKKLQAVPSELKNGDASSTDEPSENNMESLLEHFTKVSEYVLPDQLDLSTRNYKLSLDVKQLFTTGSINTNGKVIRYDKGIVHIMDEQYFRRNEVLKNLVDLRELYFLIEYYLAEFGNNWPLVTECLRLNPFARAMMLSREQVENLHAFFNMKRGNNITCKDRMLLPFSNQFQQRDTVEEDSFQQGEMEIDNYEELIRQECQNLKEAREKKHPRKGIDVEFERFSKYCESIGIKGKNRTVVDNIVSDEKLEAIQKETIKDWGNTDNIVHYSEKKAQKTEFAYQAKLTLPKSCKIANIKKRKIVSDRTSPLVQTLARIKNKQQPTPSGGMMYKPGVVKSEAPVLAPPAVVPPPVVPIVKTESVIKGVATKDVPPGQLSKIHESKKGTEGTGTPTKKAPGGIDKKSGQKGAKKKDDKK